VLRESDFLVIACPLAEDTRGLIGRERLALMKPSAVLVNVGRGPVVDEVALYDALARRRIAGAVLDVWYRYATLETPDVRPSHLPFHELDNVVMTPHCSGWTEGLIPRRFAVIIDNVERLRDGRPLRNPVHPAV
jgi:phosphoglycerate dehydrogenase-like enzyme